MHGSQGVGLPLVKYGSFGADMIRLEDGQFTEVHTHPGDHILFVVEGAGYVLFDGKLFPLVEGDCYFIPGGAAHQVGSESLILLLSVASNHFPVSSSDRLQVVGG